MCLGLETREHILKGIYISRSYGTHLLFVARYEALTAVMIKFDVFWVVMQCEEGGNNSIQNVSVLPGPYTPVNVRQSDTLDRLFVTLVTHIYQVVLPSSVKVKFNLKLTASSSSNLAQHTQENVSPNLCSPAFADFTVVTLFL
jgi:hypothetical protein